MSWVTFIPILIIRFHSTRWRKRIKGTNQIRHVTRELPNNRQVLWILTSHLQNDKWGRKHHYQTKRICVNVKFLLAFGTRTYGNCKLINEPNQSPRMWGTFDFSGLRYIEDMHYLIIHRSRNMWSGSEFKFKLAVKNNTKQDKKGKYKRLKWYIDFEIFIQALITSRRKNCFCNFVITDGVHSVVSKMSRPSTATMAAINWLMLSHTQTSNLEDWM